MNAKTRVENTFELIWGVGTRILLRILLWAGLAYVLLRLRSVLAAVLLAAVLTYTVLPVVDFLCSYQVRGMKRRTQRIVATTLVFMVLISLGTTFTVLFLQPLGGELVGLRDSLQSSSKQVATMVKSVSKWYGALPEDLQKLISQQQFNSVGERAAKWFETVLGNTVNWLTHLLDLVLIPVLAFYFTLDSRAIKREFVGLVPKRRTREALAILHEVNAIMRSYVIGQIILCVIAGLFVGIVLGIVKMPYVLVLAILSGVTRAIPVIGPIIAGIVIVVLAAAQSTLLGVNMLIFFIFLHFAESKFVMPKLIGDRMQLHPALILIVLLIGSEFFGLLGMFLAAPVAALLRVLVRFYIIKPKKAHVWGLSSKAETAEIV